MYFLLQNVCILIRISLKCVPIDDKWADDKSVPEQWWPRFFTAYDITC